MFISYIYRFLVVNLLLCSFSVRSSENVIFDKHIPRELIDKINSMQRGQFIGCSMFCFTDQKMIKALCDATKRGVVIRVCIGQRMMGVAGQRVAYDEFKSKGIKVIMVHGLHAKMWLFADTDPILGSIDNPVGYLGSSNATHKTYHNYEIMVKDTSLRFFVDTYNQFLLEDGEELIDDSRYNTPTKAKKPLKGMGVDTPPNHSVVSSKQVDLNALIAGRITTTPSKKTLCCMAVTNGSVVAALKSAGKSVKLVVDKFQLTSKNGRNILSELNEAGVDVRVHMGSKNGYLHAKSMTRASDSSRGQVAMVTTGNCTDMGTHEINGLVTTKSAVSNCLIGEKVNTIFSEAKPLSEIPQSKIDAIKQSRKRTSKENGSVDGKGSLSKKR